MEVDAPGSATDESLRQIVAAINTVSSFLAHEQIRDSTDLLRAFGPEVEAKQLETDVIVLCGSAVLSTAESVFSAVNEVRNWRSQDDKTSIPHRLVLVLCGGIGHSTHYMHEAVARHPMYKALASQVVGRPEAQVLQVIAKNVFGMTTHDEESEHVQRTDDDSQGVFKVLVEDKSTNCGANAAFSRNLLERNGIYKPRTIIVAQDPTMCRRTVASFQKTYEDELARPTILSWPTFVPRVGVADEGSAGATGKDTLGQLGYQPSRNTTGDADDLWDMERFVDLIMGEVPRLRDDECGYGPCGKGFITHVDVPQQVDEAWDRLRLSLGVTERTV